MAQDINNPADLPEQPIDENTRVVASVGWPTGTGAVVDLDTRFVRLPSAGGDEYVLKAGDTMTGILEIERSGGMFRTKDPTQPENERAFQFANVNRQFEIRQAGDGGQNQRTFIALNRDTGVADLSGSASVVVPDATADGQALAHSQSGAVLGSNARVTGGYNNLTLESGSADPSRLRWLDAEGIRYQMETTAAGDWVLSRYLDGVYQDIPLSINSAGVVRVPAVADGATEAAAQVTAKDSTTGQLAIGGIEVGDTGWRDVSSLLLNGWTAVSRPPLLRRVGNTVILKIQYRLDGSAQTDEVFINPPDGFRSEHSFMSLGWLMDNSNAPGTGNPVSCMIDPAKPLWSISCYSTSATLTGELTWQADYAWPTSLPGTPV